MTKTKLIWIGSGIAALAAIALILFLPRSVNLSIAEAKVEQLPEGHAISINTVSERFGVLKGDTFKYMVEILFDPSQVSEINKSGLDNNVSFEPFEMRSVEDAEFELESGTHVFQRLYELQLIAGDVEKLYEFPTIVVQYKLKEAEGYAEFGVMPVPIYVASRLPADVGTFVGNVELGFGPLKPLKGEIEDASQNRLPWIFWVLGGFLAVVAVTDLRVRVIPKLNEKTNQGRKVEMNDVLFQSYRLLYGNMAKGGEPRTLLHQISQMLKVVLTRKEKVGWLDDPDLASVSPEIRPALVSLFEKSQKAYGKEDIAIEDVREGMKQLEEILCFYFTDEVDAWKSWLNS